MLFDFADKWIESLGLAVRLRLESRHCVEVEKQAGVEVHAPLENESLPE